ncbi:MAG: hypothetical protein K6T86_08870 [Pirellulales bacterium]|nr:hypothetical protein [Pirellulales bacterium]
MNATASPYIRESLRDTRLGLADPRPLVAGWIQEASELLGQAVAAGEQEPELARKLAAAHLRLRRVRPELLENAEAGQVTEGLARWFKQHGPEVAALLPRLDVSAWQRDAAALDASYEEDWQPEQRTALAEKLLKELDDAQLVAQACEEAGFEDAQYGEQLEVCDAWCLMHADLLLAAATHVQAVGLALRPDLLDVDAQLALSAVKYEAILDAAVEMEQTLGLRCAPEEAEAIQPWVRPFLATQPRVRPAAPQPAGYPRSLLPQIVALAAEQAPPAPQLLCWQSPDGAYRACLALPRRVPDPAEPLVVAFSTAAEQPAEHLAGTAVTLAGAAAAIDSQGKARWTLRSLTDTGEDLVLTVGTPPVAWLPHNQN